MSHVNGEILVLKKLLFYSDIYFVLEMFLRRMFSSERLSDFRIEGESVLEKYLSVARGVRIKDVYMH